MINIRKLEAQYDYLLNLPDDISAAGLVNKDGQPMTSLGEVVNNAMQLIEDQSEQLTGVLPISYTDFSDDLSLVKMIVNIIEPKSGILLDKTTPRLIQFHTLKNAANPPFLGGFSIFGTVAA